MKLIDLVNAPWALMPERLAEIQSIYATHLRGDKIDLDAVEQRLGRPLNNQPTAYTVHEGGVAVIDIEGVIAAKANLFTQVSGGLSARMLEKAMLDAKADPAVKSLIQVHDSPGGSVFGTPEVAVASRAFAEEKPLVSIATAQMCSASYWIGSAANAIYITGPTVQVGSIGVVATHEYNPRASGQVTEITAGQYKRIASGSAPLSMEGKAYLQAQVDHLYQVFVDTVAMQRGVSAEQVLERMADGRVFTGQQAIDAGLVDGVSSLDALVAELASNPDRYAKRRKAVFAVGSPSKGAGAAPKDKTTVKKGSSMSDDNIITRASLEQDHAAVFAQVKAEFMAVGAQSERDRISGVREQVIPGHEALIEQLAFDGKTSPAEAAMAVNAAQRSALAAAASAHANDAPNAAPAAAAPADTAAKSKADVAIEAQAYAAANGVDIVTALKKLGHA
jgi:signal peptide peptidase SppA